MKGSPQALHCHVYSLELQRYFFLLVIYASNNAIERITLWMVLSEIKASMPDVPWPAVGDFNMNKSMMECSKSVQGMANPSPTLECHQCLHDIELLDMPHSGPYFTWTSKRAIGPIAKKIRHDIG